MKTSTRVFSTRFLLTRREGSGYMSALRGLGSAQDIQTWSLAAWDSESQMAVQQAKRYYIGSRQAIRFQINRPNQSRQNDGSWFENKQEGLMMKNFQTDSGNEEVISKQNVEKLAHSSGASLPDSKVFGLGRFRSIYGRAAERTLF